MTTKFKGAECYKRFKNEIHKCSIDLNNDETGSINTMWKKIHDTIKEELAEVLGILKNKKILV